jgi:hypothetical protein
MRVLVDGEHPDVSLKRLGTGWDTARLKTGFAGTGA